MTPSDRDVELFARTLPEALLQCRELGHAWRAHTASWNASARVYDRSLRCQRCATLRVETLSKRGEILTRHYEYPDGYLSQDLGRIVGSGRDVLRRESLTRQLEKAG